MRRLARNDIGIEIRWSLLEEVPTARLDLAGKPKRSGALTPDIFARIRSRSSKESAGYAEARLFSLADEGAMSPRRRFKYSDFCPAANRSMPRNVTRRTIVS